MKRKYCGPNIDAFGFTAGFVLAKKYSVIKQVGQGWEGEVYQVLEIDTGIERAAKLFYPQNNPHNSTAITYAKKLHALRECGAVIHYHSRESILFRKTSITVLVSEYVDGELLADYINKFPGKRVPLFQGIHLLYALISAIESIHAVNEYHGDLHAENVIVRRLGLSYDLKLLDLFHVGRVSQTNRNDDLCDSIRIFYDAIGGRKHYSKHPKQIKYICCGLKRSLILKKFKTASALRLYLETQEWN